MNAKTVLMRLIPFAPLAIMIAAAVTAQAFGLVGIWCQADGTRASVV